MGIWNSISALNGKTLVNIVGEIWDVGTTLVSNIKSGLSNFADKVKAGLKYIAESVTTFILQSLVFILRSLIKAIGFGLKNSVSNLLTIEETSNGLMINNEIPIEVELIEKTIVITVDNIKITMDDILNPITNNVNFETLSLASDIYKTSFLGIKVVNFLLVLMTKDRLRLETQSIPIALTLIATHTIMSLTSLIELAILNNPSINEEDFTSFENFNLAGLGSYFITQGIDALGQDFFKNIILKRLFGSTMSGAQMSQISLITSTILRIMAIFGIQGLTENMEVYDQINIMFSPFAIVFERFIFNSSQKWAMNEIRLMYLISHAVSFVILRAAKLALYY